MAGKLARLRLAQEATAYLVYTPSDCSSMQMDNFAYGEKAPPVPEPSSFTLVLAAAAVGGALRLRRHRK